MHLANMKLLAWLLPELYSTQSNYHLQISRVLLDNWRQFVQ